jgi:hypothetical protein
MRPLTIHPHSVRPEPVEGRSLFFTTRGSGEGFDKLSLNGGLEALA